MSPPPSSNLCDSETFPSFECIPHGNSIETLYRTVNGGCSTPTRHWCLITEITTILKVVRLSIFAKDCDGHEFLVHVHTDNRGAEPVQYCREGYTLVLLYAQRHHFADGTVGIRLEEGASVRVLPYPYTTLMAANDLYFGEEGKGMWSLWHQPKGGSRRSEELFKVQSRVIL